MARLYGAATTDRVTFTQGSGFTGLDNLAQGNLTAIAVGRRTQNNQMYLMSKTPGTTAGWEFMNGGWVGGTTNGHLRILVWTSGTRYDFQSGTAEGVDISVLNQHELWAVTWNGTTKTPVFYRNAIQTPVVATSGPTAVTTGSGTLGSDAATSFTGWNNTRALTTPMLGDGSWLILFNRVLSQAEIQTVQAGVLMYRAGVEAASAATKTRGVNIIKAVSGYVMINYQDSTGACTEFSGNDITGVNTGTITAGAESANWFAPTSFAGDLETTLAEQTLYRYTSEFARTAFTTSATSFTAWYRTTLDPATYPNQAVAAYEIDGAITAKMSSGAVNTYGATTVSSLSASSKVITLINGVRSHPNAVAAPHQGTFVTLVQFGAAATENAVVAPTKRLVVLGDSVGGDGFLADYPQRYQPFQALRRALPGWLDDVHWWGAGGMEFRDYFVDGTARADVATRVATANTAAVVLWLGGNDKFRANWSTVTAQSEIVAGINALLAARPAIHVFILGTTTMSDATTNVQGDTLASWRTLEAALAALTTNPSHVHFYPTTSWYTAGDTADGTHPTTVTYSTLVNPQVATIFATSPVSKIAHAGLAGGFFSGGL